MMTTSRWTDTLLLVLAVTGLLGNLTLHIPDWQFGLTELLLMLSLACLLVWQWRQSRRQRVTLDSLRQERDLNASLLDGVPGLVYLFDDQMRFRHWNSRLQTQTGYSAQEIAGMHPLDFFGDPDREAVAEAIRAAFEQGQETIEADLLTREGIAIPFHFNSRSLMLNGQPCLLGMGFDVSPLRQAQQAAEQARQVADQARLAAERVRARLEQVLAVSPAILYTFRLDPYKITFVSDAIQTLTGHTPQECLADPQFWYDSLHPQDRQAALECQALLLEQGWLEHEYRFRTRDGSYRWIHDRLVVIRDEQGRPIEVVGAWLDITCRQEATQALRESETRFRTLAEHAPVGIFEADTVGSTRYLNTYVAERLGHPAEQLLEEQWMDALHPDDRERVVQGWLAAALEGRDYSAQYRFLRPEGEVIWVFGSAAPLRDEQGQVIGYIGTLVDITALKLAQSQLSLWGKAIEAVHNGIVIADATRSGYPILSVNPAYERITGYSAQEVVDHSNRFLHQGEEDQPGLVELRQALQEGRDAHVVVRNYRKDGTAFWNELYVAPVRDETGQVIYFVGVQNDITERRQQETRLLYQAQYDGLTGLPNRDLLHDRLEQALIQAQRSNEQVAVLFVDLDRFKMVNDSLGHRVGDVLLQIVAGRLKGCVRESDTVARLGGDEFVIVLRSLTDSLQAAKVGEKILAVLQEPVALEGQDLLINASIGIALFPANGAEPAALLKHADAALHQAKETGRGTLCFHAQVMQEQAQRRLSLSTDLRQALERDELTLHYQPQVSLRSGQVVGVEALLRWEHPHLGMIAPAEFIPQAEETGLIVPLGEWVLRTACTQTQAWQDAGLGLPTVAVNLSTRQFIQRNLPQRIGRILQETGLLPQYLELEITESLLMRDVKGATHTLQALKALGLTLALDDFGTGYSSLNDLKRFPLNRLKIDQSFVRDITTDTRDAAIVQAVIELARSLKLKVLAEGVETAAQLAFLRAKGCDDIQGWYFSRALPPDRLTELLRQNRRLRLPRLDSPTPLKRTVLLVDDDQVLLKLVGRLLEREGYQVFTAISAEAGFEVLARHPVEVAIVDHVLPGLSGTAFLYRIRELYPQVLRILLSGYGERKVLVEAINQGAVYQFLEKPVNAQQLRDLLHEVFLPQTDPLRLSLLSTQQGRYPALAT